MAIRENEIVIGIDSSTSCTGIAVLSNTKIKPKILELKKVYTEDLSCYEEKSNKAYKEIKAIYEKYKDKNPIVAIELLNSPKNLHTTRLLAGLWGFIICSLYKEYGIVVRSINTGQAKKTTTGDGSADKEKIIKYVNKFFNLKLVYSNSKEKSDDDVADAISIALTTIRLNK